jgi:hypothetical protein
MKIIRNAFQAASGMNPIKEAACSSAARGHPMAAPTDKPICGDAEVQGRLDL